MALTVSGLDENPFRECVDRAKHPAMLVPAQEVDRPAVVDQSVGGKQPSMRRTGLSIGVSCSRTVISSTVFSLRFMPSRSVPLASDHILARPYCTRELATLFC